MAPRSFPAPKSGSDLQFSTGKESHWWARDLVSLPPQIRRVFEEYSGLPARDVIPHIYRIRQKAWLIKQYPCIGGFLFLELGILAHPEYASVRKLLMTDADSALLDLGCCFGQDLRKLVFDGVPSTQLYGTDISPDVIELGYELFCDRNSFRGTMIAADIFDEHSRLFEVCKGRMDIINACMIIHLFSWDVQLRLCKNIYSLLKKRPGSAVIGYNVASITPGEFEIQHREQDDATMYVHSPDTFHKLWKTVDPSLEVNATIRLWDSVSTGIEQDFTPPFSGWDFYWMTFTVRIVSEEGIERTQSKL